MALCRPCPNVWFFVNQGSFDHDSSGAGGGASRGLGGNENDERGEENIVLTDGIVFQVLHVLDSGSWCVPQYIYAEQVCINARTRSSGTTEANK